MLKGKEFIGIPGDLSFRGKRIFRLSGRDDEQKVAIIQRGIIEDSEDTKGKHYGEYLFSIVRYPTKKRGSIVGSIQTPEGKHYSITGEFRARRQKAVLKVFLNNEESRFKCAYKGEILHARSRAEKLSNEAQSTPTIRILVAYTRQALAKCGNNHNTVQALVNYEMTRLQQSAEDSALGVNFEAAGSAYFIDEAASDDAGILISKIISRGESEPYGEAIFSEISAREADMVHLLSAPTSTASGIGIGPKSFIAAESGRSSFAVSYVNSSMNADSRLFAHETGHVLGGHHDAANVDAGVGLYTDARGHLFTGQNAVNYGTIIAYSLNGESSAHYFSNPEVSYMGTATGVTGQADNARLMKVIGPMVASYSDYDFFNLSGSFTTELVRDASEGRFQIRAKFSKGSDNPTFAAQSISLNSVNEDNSFLIADEKNFTTENVDFIATQGQSYFVSLAPDYHIKGEKVFVPKEQDIVISLNLEGNKLNGQVTLVDETPLLVGGSWLSIYLLENKDGQAVYTPITTPVVNQDGSFAHVLTEAGTYVAGFKSGDIIRYSSAIYFSGEAEATPTATATPEGGNGNDNITNLLRVKHNKRKAKFKGKLRQDGEPLKGSSVTLYCDESLKKSALSKKNGNYRFVLKRPRQNQQCYTMTAGNVLSKLVKLKKRKRSR